MTETTIVLPAFLSWRFDFRTELAVFPQGGQGAPKDSSNSGPAGPVTSGGPQEAGTQAPGSGQPKAPPGMGQCFDTQTMLMMAAMFAVFYFLLIRPQQKQEKARRAMLAKADKGDKVVTTSGIHGVIVSGDKDTVTLRVDADVKLRFDRSAIARIVNESAEVKPDASAGKDKKG